MRILYRHAARLEAAYDIASKVRQDWTGNSQDVQVLGEAEACGELRQLVFDACYALSKVHAAMLEIADENKICGHAKHE